MIDLTKTYRLHNEKSYKLISQPRIRSVSEIGPEPVYVLEAEWEDIATGEVNTEVWTAEGKYFCGAAPLHDWDLVEVEVPPKKPKLDPSKKYRLRNPEEYELVGPLVFGTDQTARFSIAAQVRAKATGNTIWWTWKADGSWAPDGRKTDSDLVEDVPEWADWPIDAPVLYRSKGQKEYTKAHYAGELDGRPTVWILGVTSWTAEYLTGAHETRQFAFEIELADEE